MLFALRNDRIIPVKFNPPLPQVTDKKILPNVLVAAIEFWNEVIKDDRISPSFKIIAKECKSKITELQGLAALLPD